MLSTLWNTYAFYILYAEIDKFNPNDYKLEYEKLSVMDKWLLSRLNSTVKSIDDNLSNYRIPETTRAIQTFVDEMSNWYVRRSRARFWSKGMEQDKINAYMTLYTSLLTICKASAPVIPFITEDIYQNIVRSVDKSAPDSIHLCDFPTVDENIIDTQLETDMEHVLDAVVLGRSCRNTSNIKTKQPVAKMYIKADWQLSDYYTDIIAGELNVKNVAFASDVSEFTSYSFKPQLRTVGPKYGKLLGGIKTYLAEVDGLAAMASLKESGELKFEVNGEEVVLKEEDLLISSQEKEGYISTSDNDITVVIDANLTPELIEEGFVRELISKIQTMRKEAGFDVMDTIRVYVSDNAKIVEIMANNAEKIKSEVLAVDIINSELSGYQKQWSVNNEEVTLAVEKNG